MEPSIVPVTLLVKHLPSQLSNEDCEELLAQFGARKVKFCGRKGPLKYAAFAQFDNHEHARNALRQLHQLDLLGKRLSVEYAKKCTVFDESKPPTRTSEINERETKQKSLAVESNEPDIKQVSDKINSISEKWNVTYPRNPKLKYSYPPPSVSILTNIANALAAVPRFYVQVLHLMNRMNLPAPFGEITPTPPLPEEAPPPLPAEPEITEEEMAISSTEESELESEEDSSQKLIGEKKETVPKVQRKKLSNRKRPRLVLGAPQVALKPGTTSVKIDDVFEQPSAKIAKRIEIKQVAGEQTEPESEVDLFQKNVDIFSETTAPSHIDEQKAKTVTSEEGGFGKIEPIQKKPLDETEEAEEEIDSEFITSRKLRRGRISSKEMRELSVFRRYERGEPTSRLYIKNISKQSTEKDLRYIFGRYVDWDNDLEKTMFDIRLMKEGRMKGQAFVSLSSAEKAQEALEETHGYELHGKPLVVQFARSSKPKEGETKSETKTETKSAKS